VVTRLFRPLEEVVFILLGGIFMDSLLLFLITFVTMFILYIIFFYIIGLKKKSIMKSMQIEFLKVRFNLRNKDFNQKKIGLIICILDPLIIALTGTIVTLPKWNYILELILGFVLLMIFIYSFYEILGRIIRRKVDKK